MYESHFGFHRTPFQSFDPARLFIRSESIGGILPRLLRSVRSSLGLGLVTAVHGTGRTALLKYLQHELQNEGRTVLVSGAALDSSATLLQLLMHSAVRHAGSAAGSEQSLPSCTQWNTVECLRKSMDFWGPVILLLDDVHLAPLSVLNELRAISEEEWNGRALVRVLATAPVSFEMDLTRSEYSGFAHRIRCHEVLQSLTVRESVEYLQRQLEAAGGRLAECFTEDAVNRLVDAGDGLPRSLSLLADETLAIAAEQLQKPADLNCVTLALKRLQHLACRLNSALSADVTEAGHTWGAGEPATVEPTVERPAVYGTVTHLSADRPRAAVVEFGELPATAAKIADVAPGSVEFGAVAESEAAVESETDSPGSLSPEVSQPFEGVVETGVEPADFSTWVPVPARYTWMDMDVETHSDGLSEAGLSAESMLPLERWTPNPITSVPRSMAIEIQSADDDEILRLLSERRRAELPVVETETVESEVMDSADFPTESAADDTAGTSGPLQVADEVARTMSPGRSIENRRDIFGGSWPASATPSVPRSMTGPTVYTGDVLAEPVAEESSEDRFATLFTRLRKLRAEKSVVVPGQAAGTVDQVRRDG